MARLTIKQKVDRLPGPVKERLSQGAQDGKSISEMTDELDLEYSVAQAFLWQVGTLPWQGAKSIISKRLKSLRTATKREDRERLAREALAGC